MKNIFPILAALLFTAGVFAQTPNKMSYQAVIRDASNNLVIDQPIGVQISILQDNTNGPVVYVETQTSTTNANGMMSIEIGTGTTSYDFAGIDWANGPFFLKTETDPIGGTNYTIVGVSQLLSVPYALHATTAESLTQPVEESDPVFNASTAAEINETDITSWNNKLELIDNRLVLSGTKDAGAAPGTGVFEIANALRIDENEIITNTDAIIYVNNTNNGDVQMDRGTFFLDASENAIGIGTTTPGAQLEIAGDVKIVDGTQAEGRVLTSDAEGHASWKASHSLAELAASDNTVNSQLKKVSDPTEDQDAATKAYVDQLLIQLLDADKLIAAGYTLQELKDGGHTIESLLSVNTDSATVALLGYSVEQLRVANYTAHQLLELDFGAQTLIDGGFTLTDLMNAGITQDALLTLGLTPEELYHEGHPIESLLAIDNVTPQDIIAFGATFQELLAVENISREDFYGMSYQGGILFDLDEDGLHGLIISPEVKINNASLTFGGGSTYLGTSLTDGKANTELILEHYGTETPTAAKACVDYTNDGYADWFLPAKEQWELIYSRRDYIENISPYGNFSSSSEYSPTYPDRNWVFMGNRMSNIDKSNSSSVRAIRAF